MREKGFSKVLWSMPKNLYKVYLPKQQNMPSKNLKLPYDNNTKISQIDNH